MRLSILLFCMAFHICFAQKATFKITHYNPEGKIVNEAVKVLDRPSNLSDLNYFKKYFHMPREIPEKLRDEKYKSTMIVTWKDEKNKNLNNNWNHTFTYDSLSRISVYSYSGCMMCSLTAYKFQVKYNSSGQVESLKNTINGNEVYKVTYNDKGHIIQIDYFADDKLRESVVTDF